MNNLSQQYLQLSSHGVLGFEFYCTLNWRRQWHPTPVLLPGESHGWRSLVGCGPWDCCKSAMTEQLHFHFSLSCAGEGNGNPLQCSCLENPRDGGAWWAAVYGVAQGRTRPKQLSSSSSQYPESVKLSPRNYTAMFPGWSRLSGVSQAALMVKNLPAMQETWVQPLDQEGGGHENSPQYFCLENPMDRGAWQAAYSP